MIANSNYHILYRIIGYHFNSEELITQALTHRSKNSQNNERLEFLGDAILGFVIAEAIYHKFPQESEGNLSLLRMYLVRGNTLTEIAKNFDLGTYMNFGIGELKSGGNKRARLLEDALEALIGAIYLDSSLKTVKSCILSWYKDKLKNLNIKEYVKDPKSRLQEYLQSKIHMKPTYTVIDVQGKNHDQIFLVEVFLDKLNKKFQGKGKSKKQAEHMAARLALASLLPF